VLSPTGRIFTDPSGRRVTPRPDQRKELIVMPVVLAAVGPLGLAIGSFLNVVIHRVPARMSLVRPGSACPNCDHAIRNRHNVPVFGWLALRGRCADCQAPISARYPIVEFLTGALFVALVWRLAEDHLLAAAPALLYFLAIGIALSAIDIDHHRLPDVLVLSAYPVVTVLLTTGALLSGTPVALLRALIGGAALFAAYFVVHIAYPGGMGYGDVKLAGVVGGVLAYVSYPALLVGTFAAFLFATVAGSVLMAINHGGRKTAVPFGPFMVGGALFALFFAPAIAHAYASLALA
jgi:leader peptidase (prepilin peptidase)/N-methyltransferase